jgi:hypothetical protein
VEKDVAESIKKDFDRRHGATWHCIVGRNFGKPRLFISLSLSLHIGHFPLLGFGSDLLLYLFFFFGIWNGVCGFEFVWDFWVL